MTRTTKLEVSLETYKRIESERLNFDETSDEILKRLLKIKTNTECSPQHSSSVKPSREIRQARSAGIYRLSVLGDEIKETSMTRSLCKLIERLQTMDHSFMQRLSEKETPGRRVISRVPEKLYKKSPKLAEEHAEPFSDGWYIDSNISYQQYLARLEIISDVAGLKFETDIKVIAS